MEEMKRKDLLKKIGEVSFSMDELRLFLDTHPNCKEALEYMEMLVAKREEYVKHYEKKYGPLCWYGVNVSGKHWCWVDEAWPWEGEC